MSKGTVNKVILIGRLGKDPELRYMPSGEAVANFRVATNEGYKDKSGQFKEATEWHKMAAFGKNAEIIGEFLKKGSLVYIEGKLKTEKWQDKDGKDCYTTSIVVKELQMLGNKADDSGEPEQDPETKPLTDKRPKKPTAPVNAKSFDKFENDIPF